MIKIFIILCINLHLFATPNIEWFQGYNGSAEESHGHYILTCQDGGFLQIGETNFLPNSKIYGYDFHEPSIIKAREKAEIEGVSNIEFAVSDAKNIPEKGYDFACIFDALHDMGDPVGVSKAILNTLNDDGTFMLVEPFANDELKDNLNTQSGLYYSFSTLICVPTSRAQEVGLQLGAQAGEKRLRSVLSEAGFDNIERRCVDIESNIVLEAKAWLLR